MAHHTIETHTHAARPSGAPFHIETLAWNFQGQTGISTIGFEDDAAISWLYDWPMVYILTNQNEAYIGQTTSVMRRMTQHGENPEKQAFTTANLIYNSEFNASVITDYENRLIGLMGADGHYQLTNKNDGMTQSNYFSKQAYEEMFADLWQDLKDMDLVYQSISEIEDSEIFKYSPFKCLNDDQTRALENIMDAIDRSYDATNHSFRTANPIVVEGEPGTGKTVLAVYLLKSLRDNPKFSGLNIKILEPVTALRTTLQKALGGVYNLSAADIIGPGDLVKEKYGFVPGKTGAIDILLVDEAHKLKRRKNLGTQFGNFDDNCRKLGLDPSTATQVDWILNQTKLPIFFYDPQQNIGPSGAGDTCFSEKLGDALKHPIHLHSQMRVAGGNPYLDYIQALLSGQNVQPQTFGNYEFVLHTNFAEFEHSFEEHLDQEPLTRMLAGYAWKWATKGKGTGTDIILDGVEKRWNTTYNNWIGLGFDDPSYAHEVGCIHSSQGYDLSYAYVIIGPDLVLDSATGQLRGVRESYFDHNGKNTATDEELTRYIKNIYYVLLTRGIKGTHIYICDDGLRELWKSYIAPHQPNSARHNNGIHFCY